MNIYSNKTLEKTPLGKLKNSQKIIDRTLNKFDANADPKLNSILQKCAYQVKTRGIYIRECYEDFDRHNNGNVTKTQFLRAFPFTNLNNSEIDILVQRYSDPVLHDVNYKKFINEVNSVIQSNSRTNTTATFTPLELLPHQRDSIRLKPTNHDYHSVMQEIAKFVRQKQIRIQEFFQQFDRHNNGLILVDNFGSALKMIGLNLTNEEIQNLSEEYKTNVNFTNYIKYKDFCNDIEDMKNNLFTTKTRDMAYISRGYKQAIDKIRQAISQYRMNILPTFQDFDRFNRGYITPQQFQRSLYTLNKVNLNEFEVKELIQHYSNDVGVDYFSFIEDVDPSHNQQRRVYNPLGTTKESIEEIYGKTPTGDKFITSEQADKLIYKSHKGLIPKLDEPTDITSLIESLQKWCYINSVHFHEFLKDFDPLNIGEITDTQFRRGIEMSSYKLSDKQYKLIKNNYKSKTRVGYIRWRDFADDILQFIAPKDLETKPLTQPLSPKELTMSKSRDIPNESKDIQNIINLISRYVKMHRLPLIEQFKDKDRYHHKAISRNAFAQVIQLIGMHLTKDQIEKLCNYYTNIKTNFVDYVNFVDDVNNEVGQIFDNTKNTTYVANPFPEYGNTENMYLTEHRSNENDFKVKEIIKNIQSFVWRRRIRLEEFFESFDNLRHGIVPIQKFRTVCGQVNLPLNPQQITLIIEKYRAQSTNDMFDYKKFCKKINKIFGKTEMEKKPLKSGKTKYTINPEPSKVVQTLSQNEEMKVRSILLRMKNLVLTRRMNIRDQFYDFDTRPRKSYISKQQFKQCIARLGLSYDQNELDLLSKKFRCTSLDEVNYMKFCNEIDPNYF